MGEEEFQQNIEAGRAAGDGRGEFFELVYNEQHAAAAQWFGQRGWTAVDTPLANLLRDVGRPVPDPWSESGRMVFRTHLVSAWR